MKKGLFVFVTIIVLVLGVTGCGKEDKKKLKDTMYLNEHGDFVSDNFKIEYNEHGDITSIETPSQRDMFTYTYNDNNQVTEIFYNDNDKSIIHFEFTYYDNGKPFLLKSTSNSALFEQYYLYDDNDELKHIVSTTYIDAGLLLSNHITEFVYYNFDGADYVVENTYNASTGAYGRGRLYEKKSMENAKNNLEKYGIITLLMVGKNSIYNNGSRGTGLTVLDTPIGPYIGTSNVLHYCIAGTNGCPIMSNVYDDSGNYVYTTGTGATRTLYEEKNGFRREEVGLEENIHTTYKYTKENEIVNKLEIYKEELSDDEKTELISEYRDNNLRYKAASQSVKLLDYTFTKVNNAKAYYNSYLNTIKKNGNKYNLYKKSSNSNNVKTEENNENKTSYNNDYYNDYYNDDYEVVNDNNKQNNTNNNSSNNEVNNNNYNNNNNNNNSTDNNDKPGESNINKLNFSLSIKDAVNNNPLWLYYNVSADEYGNHCTKCSCDVYLNNSLFEKDVNCVSSNTVTISNYQVGKNEILVKVKQNGNVVKELNTSFNFDFEKIPTPTFNISGGFSTTDSKAGFTIFGNDNGCYNCGFILYINGTKRKSIYDTDVNLEVGRNEFTVEVANKFGKKSCKKVYINRYEVNASFNDMEKWEITGC